MPTSATLLSLYYLRTASIISYHKKSVSLETDHIEARGN